MTVSTADRLTPKYVAEMVTWVVEPTLDVVIVKFALVAPAGTVTVLGTRAVERLLERETTAPPLGAGPLRTTVPVDEDLAFTVEGESVKELGVTLTVSTAALVAPP